LLLFRKPMDKKTKDALVEGLKKGACVVTNAAMFFYYGHLFNDESWFPADPVWVHITITMLCELDTMDRLNEKILLRTAGTTIGAVSGVLMSYSGLSDVQRLVVIMIWISSLGYIEAKDPQRSYTWTIATVTFGICTYLGRMGKHMTPWKRWFSIVLGTIVTCVWQLLLPHLGLLPKKIIRDELGATAQAAWSGSMAMLEDAIQNAGDVEATKRLAEKQASIHASLTKWPALWKQYKFARNWMNLQPMKALPMDGLQELLKGPLLQLFLSSWAASRMLHCSKQRPDTASLRGEIHKMGLAVTSVIKVAATKDVPVESRASGMAELGGAVAAAEAANKQLGALPSVHKALFAAVLVDMVKVVAHLEKVLGETQSRTSKVLVDLADTQSAA